MPAHDPDRPARMQRHPGCGIRADGARPGDPSALPCPNRPSMVPPSRP